MAAAAHQGGRRCMEDFHYLAALDPHSGPDVRPRGPVRASHRAPSVGVFDGHAGALTAAFAARHMPELLHGALAGGVRASLCQPAAHSTAAWLSEAAVAGSFLSFDRWWSDARCDPCYTGNGWDESGATALVGLVAGDTLTVGNAGDGAALLARGGRSHRLSEEHRAEGNEEEARRVVTAGGRLVALTPGAVARVTAAEGPGRYRASMVTRSLGDFSLKHPAPILSPEPALASVTLTPADRLLLVATDGVTDVVGDDDALGAALDALDKARDTTDDATALAQAAADAVVRTALAAGSSDNLTAAVMVFDWTAYDG